MEEVETDRFKNDQRAIFNWEMFSLRWWLELLFRSLNLCWARKCIASTFPSSISNRSSCIMLLTSILIFIAAGEKSVKPCKIAFCQRTRQSISFCSSNRTIVPIGVNQLLIYQKKCISSTFSPAPYNLRERVFAFSASRCERRMIKRWKAYGTMMDGLECKIKSEMRTITTLRIVVNKGLAPDKSKIFWLSISNKFESNWPCRIDS